MRNAITPIIYDTVLSGAGSVFFSGVIFMRQLRVGREGHTLCFFFSLAVVMILGDRLMLM